MLPGWHSSTESPCMADEEVLSVQVTFEIADITSCELTPESYDVVYSRDTILHIHDKPALFKRYDSLTAALAGRSRDSSQVI